MRRSHWAVLAVLAYVAWRVSEAKTPSGTWSEAFAAFLHSPFPSAAKSSSGAAFNLGVIPPTLTGASDNPPAYGAPASTS